VKKKEKIRKEVNSEIKDLVVNGILYELSKNLTEGGCRGFSRKGNHAAWRTNTTENNLTMFMRYGRKRLTKRKENVKGKDHKRRKKKEKSGKGPNLSRAPG